MQGGILFLNPAASYKKWAKMIEENFS